MTTLARAIYILLGILYLVGGVTGWLAPSLIIPEAAQSPDTAHLVREQASALAFVGFMLLWCWRHFQQRGPIHVALLVFMSMYAAIHWFDFFEDRRHVWSPLAITLPILLLAVATPRRRE